MSMIPAWRRALRRNWLNLVLGVMFGGNVIIQSAQHNLAGALGFGCAAAMAMSAYFRELQAAYVEQIHEIELRMPRRGSPL